MPSHMFQNQNINVTFFFNLSIAVDNREASRHYRSCNCTRRSNVSPEIIVISVFSIFITEAARFLIWKLFIVTEPGEKKNSPQHSIWPAYNAKLEKQQWSDTQIKKPTAEKESTLERN